MSAERSLLRLLPALHRVVSIDAVQPICWCLACTRYRLFRRQIHGHKLHDYIILTGTVVLQFAYLLSWEISCDDPVFRVISKSSLLCRSVPERFMARRPSPAGPGWDVLIKWTNLGHEHATWEVSHQPACQLCAAASTGCRDNAGQDHVAGLLPARFHGSLQHDGWRAV